MICSKCCIDMVDPCCDQACVDQGVPFVLNWLRRCRKRGGAICDLQGVLEEFHGPRSGTHIPDSYRRDDLKLKMIQIKANSMEFLIHLCINLNKIIVLTINTLWLQVIFNLRLNILTIVHWLRIITIIIILANIW